MIAEGGCVRPPFTIKDYFPVVADDNVPPSEPHTRTAWWAEKVRKAATHDDLLEAMMEAIKQVEQQPSYAPPPFTMQPFDCGCKPYGICMNTACPRAARVTTSLNLDSARAQRIDLRVDAPA